MAGYSLHLRVTANDARSSLTYALTADKRPIHLGVSDDGYKALAQKKAPEGVTKKLLAASAGHPGIGHRMGPRARCEYRQDHCRHGRRREVRDERHCRHDPRQSEHHAQDLTRRQVNPPRPSESALQALVPDPVTNQKPCFAGLLPFLRSFCEKKIFTKALLISYFVTTVPPGRRLGSSKDSKKSESDESVPLKTYAVPPPRAKIPRDREFRGHSAAPFGFFVAHSGDGSV
jgi:hypothetical protein